MSSRVADHAATPVQRLPALSLRKNFSWMFLGRITYAVCQWGVLVILAKYGNPTLLGKYALGLAVTAPVIVIANLSLEAVQATDAKRQYRFGHYMALRMLTTTLAMVAILAIVAGSAWAADVVLVVVAIGVKRAGDALSDILFGLMKQRERMNRIGIASILNGSLSLLALWAAMVLTGNVVWAAVGSCLGSLVTLLFFNLRGAALLLEADRESPGRSAGLSWLRLLRPHFERPILARLAMLAIPLGLAAALLSLNVNIPRLFVENHFGVRQLGFFAAMAYPMVAGSLFLNTLGGAALAPLARHHANGETRAFLKLLVRLVLLGVGIGCAGVVFVLVAGRAFLTFAYRPEYADYVGVFLLFSVATAIRCGFVFVGTAITAARKFKFQLYSKALGTVVLLIASWYLIPRFALHGAVWAIIASFLAEGLLAVGFAVATLRPSASRPSPS